MRKGLAISTVLLLLAAIWIPLAGGQEAPDYEFTPALGDDLSAFGQGYVENLMLRSGAGVHLVWGPSFGGNATALDERLTQLAAMAGEEMPNNTVPLVVPFGIANPNFAGPAPIDHSAEWSWNTSGIDARVNLGSVSTAIMAETEMAGELMDGDVMTSMGLHLVLSALEAARFMDARLGWDGSMLGPINMSDPNMTDTNASNGWWLPAYLVSGDVNGTTEAWENEMVAAEPTLDSSLVALSGLLSLADYLATSDFLVGPGKAFPAGTDTEVLALADAVFKNIVAVYYDEARDMFLYEDDAETGSIANAYMAMVDYSETGDMVEYFRGWAEHRAMRMADLLVGLMNDDGTIAEGYTTAIGGTPEAYIPPFMVIPGIAGHMAHAQAAAVLFDAADRFGGMAYEAAALSCLAADDSNFWDMEENLYLSDPSGDPLMANSGDQVVALMALAKAVEVGDVDLARYRIGQVWTGIVSSGLQLSETDATGENYTTDEPDTNNNTVWKHDWVDTWGPHGVAPVMALSSTRDTATGNWTVDNMGNIHSYALMMAASVLMGMDADWFTAQGGPEVSEEHAYRMLHWTPQQWLEANEELAEEVMNLTERVAELEDLIGNGTGVVDELLAQIASLEENMSALQEDLNDSLENETVLRGQVDWLRERLEETNETVDDLEKRITVLESQVERLEESVGFKDENLTKLEEQLRAERNNVTQLQWQLDNASAALAQAEADLAAAERKLDDRNTEYDELQSRSLLIAVAALVAGMIIILVLLKMIGKL